VHRPRRLRHWEQQAHGLIHAALRFGSHLTSRRTAWRALDAASFCLSLSAFAVPTPRSLQIGVGVQRHRCRKGPVFLSAAASFARQGQRTSASRPLLCIAHSVLCPCDFRAKAGPIVSRRTRTCPRDQPGADLEFRRKLDHAPLPTAAPQLKCPAACTAPSLQDRALGGGLTRRAQH